jgi:hypothetical protein
MTLTRPALHVGRGHLLRFAPGLVEVYRCVLLPVATADGEKALSVVNNFRYNLLDID